MNPAAVATCENHEQREAIGVCVACRTRVCGECSTKVDGINYCVRCLAGLAQQQHEARVRSSSASSKAAYLSAFAYVALLSVAIWVLLVVVLPGG